MQIFNQTINRGVVLAFLFMPLSYVQAQEPEEVSPIGYGSYDEALAALKELPDAKVSQQNDWTVVTRKLENSFVIWSFTPEEHLAHPATIRREVIEQDGKVSVDMTALCQSYQEACDELILQFKRMNEGFAQLGTTEQ